MLWTKQDERRLRELLEDSEGMLRERLKDKEARDLMPYYTWDALIAFYMRGHEDDYKAAIIARKIADEFDPKGERINRTYLTSEIGDLLEGVQEIEGRHWPEGISTDITEPFEYECNELRGEVVAYLLGIPYERRPYEELRGFLDERGG